MELREFGIFNFIYTARSVPVLVAITPIAASRMCRRNILAF